MSLNRPALLRTSLVVLAALVGACEVSLGPAAPEPAEEPAQPRIRKLYAPGAEEGGSAQPRPAGEGGSAQPRPAEAPADGVPSPGAEPAAPSPEAATLKAALLGTDRKKAPPEAPAPERRSAAATERRRPVKKAQPLDDAPLAEDDAPPGSLSDGAFQSAITEWTGMKRCLEGNAGRLPASSGALRVAFTIRGDGQVVKSRVVETSNDVARAIAPCVEDRAKRIRFPAFAQSAQEIEKTAKFVF